MVFFPIFGKQLAMGQINFFWVAVRGFLPNRTELKSFIRNIFKREGRKMEGLLYIFCNDRYLLDINRRYLNHEDFTDIISFDLSSDPTIIHGEIYISVERVRENATKLGVSFKEELHRVVFHGALHLCGYKDKLKSDQVIMREMEDRYLGLYFKSE